jgi:hypothetical protein
LLTAEGIRLPEQLIEIDRLTQFGTTFRYDSALVADGRDRAIWLEWIRTLRAFVEPLIRG